MKKFENEKRSFVKRLIFIGSTVTLLLFVFALTSCDKELDIKTDFPFELEIMPVPKSIAKGETVTIRCTLKRKVIIRTPNTTFGIFSLMVWKNYS